MYIIIMKRLYVYILTFPPPPFLPPTHLPIIPLSCPLFLPPSVYHFLLPPCLSLLGNWTQALKRVIESVYSFFCYDVTTYVAGSLNVDTEEVDDEGARDRERMEEEVGREEEREGRPNTVKHDNALKDGKGKHRKEEEEGEEGEREDDEEETDNEDGETSREQEVSTEEEDTFEKDDHEHSYKNHTLDLATTRGQSAIKSHLCCNRTEHNHNSHKQYLSLPASHNKYVVAQQSKPVSSFTVENILMGNTSRSESSSSSSPGSTSHAPITTFHTLPANPTPLQHTSAVPGTAGTGGPSPYSWTSHPPVKYTKFTMVSPSSMRNGGDKRRRVQREKALSVDASSDGVINSAERVDMECDDSTRSDMSCCKEEPLSPSSSPPRIPPTTNSSQHVSTGHHHNSVIHAHMPLSRQSSSQSISEAQSHGGRSSPRSLHSYTVSQSPHQNQQYVVFFPPNFTVMASPSDVQVTGQTNSSHLFIRSSLQSSTSNHHITHQYTSPHSSTPSTPPSTSSILSPSVRHSLVTSAMPHIQTTTHGKIPDPRFHPIAPKTDAAAMIGFRTVKNVVNDRTLRKRGSKQHLTVDKVKMKKMLPKPKKLRFHMTTVVKKKRRTNSISLTAPPPSLCNRIQEKTSRIEEPSPSEHTVTTQSISAAPNMHRDSVERNSSIANMPHGADSGHPCLPSLDPTVHLQKQLQQEQLQPKEARKEVQEGKGNGITPKQGLNSLENAPARNISDSHPLPPSSDAQTHPHTAVFKDSGFHLQLVKSIPQSSPLTYTTGITNSTLTSNALNNSTLTSSALNNSTLTSSALNNSTLTSSALNNSTLTSSALNNSTLTSNALTSSAFTTSALTSTLTSSGLTSSTLIRNSPVPPVGAGPRGGRGRGRGTRGYTRRKRELTFHLYEDPTTSFRPKRTRQQS